MKKTVKKTAKRITKKQSPDLGQALEKVTSSLEKIISDTYPLVVRELFLEAYNKSIDLGMASGLPMSLGSKIIKEVAADELERFMADVAQVQKVHAKLKKENKVKGKKKVKGSK